MARRCTGMRHEAGVDFAGWVASVARDVAPVHGGEKKAKEAVTRMRQRANAKQKGEPPKAMRCTDGLLDIDISRKETPERMTYSLLRLNELLKSQQENENKGHGVVCNIHVILAALEEQSIAVDDRVDASAADELAASAGDFDTDAMTTKLFMKKTKHDLPRPEDVPKQLSDDDEDAGWREQSLEDDLDALAMPTADLLYLIKAMRIQMSMDTSLTQPYTPDKVGADKASLKREVVALRHKITQLIGVNQIIKDALLATDHLARRASAWILKKVDLLRSADEDKKAATGALVERIAALEEEQERRMQQVKRLACNLDAAKQLERKRVAEVEEQAEVQCAALRQAAQEAAAGLEEAEQGARGLREQVRRLDEQCSALQRRCASSEEITAEKAKHLAEAQQRAARAQAETESLRAEKQVLQDGMMLLNVRLSKQTTAAPPQDNGNTAACGVQAVPDTADADAQTSHARPSRALDPAAPRLEQQLMWWEDYASAAVRSPDEPEADDYADVLEKWVGEEVGGPHPLLDDTVPRPEFTSSLSSIAYEVRCVVADALTCGWQQLLDYAATMHRAAGGRVGPFSLPTWRAFRSEVLTQGAEAAIRIRAGQAAVLDRLQPLLTELEVRGDGWEDDAATPATSTPPSPPLHPQMRNSSCGAEVITADVGVQTQRAPLQKINTLKPFGERADEDGEDLMADLVALESDLLQASTAKVPSPTEKRRDARKVVTGCRALVASISGAQKRSKHKGFEETSFAERQMKAALRRAQRRAAVKEEVQAAREAVFAASTSSPEPPALFAPDESFLSASFGNSPRSPTRGQRSPRSPSTAARDLRQLLVETKPGPNSPQNSTETTAMFSSLLDKASNFNRMIDALRGNGTGQRRPERPQRMLPALK